MSLQTEWLRIGRSGPTIDGRIIKEEWLEDAAATYDTKNSAIAKIWPDHNRYVNYGKVLDVRVEKNDVGGKDLYAVLEPNAYYQSDVRYGQRVNFSMEITPDFLKSGKAYLTGLGATDDPASLATSEAKFSKYIAEAGVIRGDFIAKETRLFEDQAPANLFNQLKEFFLKNQPEDKDMAHNAALEKLSTEMAELKALFAKITPPNPDAPKQEDKPEDHFKTLADRLEALEQKYTAQKPDSDGITAEQFNALKTQLETFGQQLEDALKEQPGTDGGEHFGGSEDYSNCL